MEKIKVIQMGVGTIGSVVTRSLARRRGVEIVGAVDSDKAKVGRDLGEVAEVGRWLGVRVTDDAESLFSQTYADVVIDASCSLVREAYPKLLKPIQEGMNVISACEDLGNPYASDPGLAAKLDKLARECGATVLGTGISPGFTSDYLILALTGVCSQVHRIKYVRVSDVSCYVGGVVGTHFGLGLPPDDFRKGLEQGVILGHTGFTPSIRLIADRLGWELDDVKKSIEPLYSDDGQFLCTKTLCLGTRGSEVKIEMELRASINPREPVVDHIIVEGVPPIDVTIKPNLESTESTANAMVNAIPHVINARPGLITPADLPLIFALENDMRLFLR